MELFVDAMGLFFLGFFGYFFMSAMVKQGYAYAIIRYARRDMKRIENSTLDKYLKQP